MAARVGRGAAGGRVRAGNDGNAGRESTPSIRHLERSSRAICGDAAAIATTSGSATISRSQALHTAVSGASSSSQPDRRYSRAGSRSDASRGFARRSIAACGASCRVSRGAAGSAATTGGRGARGARGNAPPRIFAASRANRPDIRRIRCQARTIQGTGTIPLRLRAAIIWHAISMMYAKRSTGGREATVFTNWKLEEKLRNDASGKLKRETDAGRRESCVSGNRASAP